MSVELLECVEVNPETPARSTVIWLHGLGADGHDFEPIVRELRLPAEMAMRFVFPHAPVRPVTINGGLRMRAWYDVREVDLLLQEDETGVRESAAEVERLIEREREKGIPAERIVVAGFSQGGAVSLQTCLRYPVRLAGILVLSSYLPLAGSLREEASNANRAIPVFMGHGQLDPLIPLRHADDSRRILEEFGYPVEWKTYVVDHGVCAEEVADVSRWLQGVLS